MADYYFIFLTTLYLHTLCLYSDGKCGRVVNVAVAAIKSHSIMVPTDRQPGAPAFRLSPNRPEIGQTGTQHGTPQIAFEFDFNDKYPFSQLLINLTKS